MIKHKRIGTVAAALMVLAVVAVMFAWANPQAFASIAGRAEAAYITAMDKTRILDIQIIADEKAWEDMLQNATAEEYISATIIIDGEKIENAGIRPKGNSSLSAVAGNPDTDRFSFKIEFDHYITGQNWLGLDKIVVNNMQGDASYLKEYISYDIMSFAGVDSPLYAFADISLNGELWGFYLAVEALEDSYAQRVYGKDHGKLYKPESMGARGEGRMNEFIEEMGDIGGDVQIPQNNRLNQGFPQGGEPPARGAENEPPANFNENRQTQRGNMGGGFGGMSSGGISLQYVDGEVSSYSAIFDNSVFKTTENDFQRVIKSLEKLSKGEDIENIVDIEATLKYFAAHTVVVNLDSYVSNMAHNYYLYEDNGKLTILPWDYNLAFGGFQSGNASSAVNFPIDTPVSGVSLEDRPLLGKLLEVPEYMDLYHVYLREIVDGYFNSGLFEQTMDSISALISPHVEADPSAFYSYSAYEIAVTEFKKLGILRSQSIEGQLNGTIPSTSQEQSMDSSSLVDSSEINFSALGSQNGGGKAAIPNNAGVIQNTDTENMQKAMEIIQAANGEELTDEQISELNKLGLTEEQIARFQNTNQGGFVGMGGRGQANSQSVLEISPSQPTQSENASQWLVMGICTILFFAGFAFVIFFKRRRA